MCETCAVLWTLSGYASYDMPNRQAMATQFTYDLRDHGTDDDLETYVQPLTRYQNRLQHLFDALPRAERQEWCKMANQSDDFEYLMREMTDGSRIGQKFAQHLIFWMKSHLLSPHVSEARRNRWRSPRRQNSPVPDLFASPNQGYGRELNSNT